MVNQIQFAPAQEQQQNLVYIPELWQIFELVNQTQTHSVQM